MINEHLRSRFSSLAWAKKEVIRTPVTIVGAGGIGSWTALFLARVGYTNITVYDDDIVEAHNIGGQLFSTDAIGQSKVEALNSIVKQLADIHINPMQIRFEKQYNLSDNIIISAVDNMTTRKILFNKFVNQLKPTYGFPEEPYELYSPLPKIPKLFVDGRLLAEQYQVFFVTDELERIEKYKASLFGEHEAETEDCSNKQTTHFAAAIAFNIVRGINNYMNLLVQPHCCREFPFSIEDDGFLWFNKLELMKYAEI